MMIILVMVNAACLVAALAVAVRAWRPADGTDDTRTFATILAALRPVAAARLPRDAGSGPVVASSVSSTRPVRADGDTMGGGEGIVGLPLRQRLAILRCMLQGKSVEETATLTQATVPVVHSLFRLHARGGTVAPCS
jgi:hypothetical protein